MIITYDNSHASQELVNDVKDVQEAITAASRFLPLEKLLSSYLTREVTIIAADAGKITLQRNVKEGTVTTVFDINDQSAREILVPKPQFVAV